MDKPKPKRSRRSAPKSRGGCLTCKNRHVKCDEIRPLCKRCAKAGRACEGYPQDIDDLIPLHQSQDELILHHGGIQAPANWSADGLLTSRLPIKLQTTTGEELHFLEFFYQRTAPHISGFFDSDFYNRLLLQAGQFEPSIRFAMMACGAMHEHYEFQVVPEMDRQPGCLAVAERPPLALASYNKAIASLMKKLSDGSSSVESVAMCCLLFVCLECLRGDPKSAASHLRSGGSILASWRTRRKQITGPELPAKNQPTTRDPDFVQNLLIPIFQRIGAQVAVAGKLSSRDFNRMGREDLAWQDRHYDGFADLETARNQLIGVGTQAVRMVKTVAEARYVGPLTAAQVGGIQGMRRRMAHWKRAMDLLVEKMSESLKRSRRVHVLYLHQRSYDVALATSICADQCCYDEYTEDFDWIVSRCEELLAPDGLNDHHLEAFNLEEGCIPDLYLTASNCRDPVIRRRAIRLLKTGPARQGIWNARLFAKVAERQMELEESFRPTSWSSPPGAEAIPTDPALLLANLSLPPTPESLPEFYPQHMCSVQEMSLPETSLPESIPEMPLPDMSIPELSLPDMSIPELAIPDMSFPDISAPEMTLPILSSYPDIDTGGFAKDVVDDSLFSSPFDCITVPEEARIHLADIHESPVGQHQHSVTFFTKPNGLQADWNIWTEDIYL